MDAVEARGLPLGVLVKHSPPYFLRQDLSLTVELIDLSRLIGW